MTDTDKAGINEACCIECHRKITISPVSGRVFGHEDGHSTGRRDRCSYRADNVDPVDRTENPSYYKDTQGFGEIRPEGERGEV